LICNISMKRDFALLRRKTMLGTLATEDKDMRKKNTTPHAGRIVAIDIAAVLLLATAFLAVYDWLPSGKLEKAAAAVSAFIMPAASETPSPTPIPTPSPLPTATPTLSPTPSPTPAPGDFSATFPDYDTGTNADYTCQTDQYRIAVYETVVGECVVFVADVYVRDIHLLKTAFANRGYESGSSRFQDIVEMAQANGAIFAVSGDYCTVRSSGIIIRNGELLRNEYYDDLCVLLATGELITYGHGEVTAEELMADNAWQTWSFGPPLLEDGKAMEINHRLSRLNPRCAIGYYEPGHYCFIIADGRQKYYSVGMTLTELSEFCEDLGLKAAYNLDGGMTAAMVYGNEKVNQPPNGGRRAGDILYLEDLFSGATEEMENDEG